MRFMDQNLDYDIMDLLLTYLIPGGINNIIGYITKLIG